MRIVKQYLSLLLTALSEFIDFCDYQCIYCYNHDSESKSRPMRLRHLLNLLRLTTMPSLKILKKLIVTRVNFAVKIMASEDNNTVMIEGEE